MDKQAVKCHARFAVSVFFGVLSVTLIALWVRSHWRIDYIRYTGTSVTTIGYREGRLCFASRKLLHHVGRYHGWKAIPSQEFCKC